MSEFQEFPKVPRLNRDVVITEKIDGTNAQVLVEQLDRGADLSAFAHETDLVAAIDVDDAPYLVRAGSRSRWLRPGKQDNHGFSAFVAANAESLVRALGAGRHYGEWWGLGINRGYGLKGKVFSLFNVSRWGEAAGYLDPRCAVPFDPGVAQQPDAAHKYVRGAKVCRCREAREAISLNLDGGRVRSVPVLYEGPWHIPYEVASPGMPPKLVHPGGGEWAPKYCLNLLREHGSVAAPGFTKPEGVVVYHTAGNLLFKATLEGDEGHKGEDR